MAVNPTSTGACLVRIIELIGLLTFKTLQCDKMLAKLSGFDDFPNKLLNEYKNWAQSVHLLVTP